MAGEAFGRHFLLPVASETIVHLQVFERMPWRGRSLSHGPVACLALNLAHGHVPPVGKVHMGRGPVDPLPWDVFTPFRILPDLLLLRALRNRRPMAHQARLLRRNAGKGLLLDKRVADLAADALSRVLPVV